MVTRGEETGLVQRVDDLDGVGAGDEPDFAFEPVAARRAGLDEQRGDERAGLANADLRPGRCARASAGLSPLK